MSNIQEIRQAVQDVKADSYGGFRTLNEKVGAVFKKIKMDFLDVIASILTFGIYYFCFYLPSTRQIIEGEFQDNTSIAPTAPSSPPQSPTDRATLKADTFSDVVI